MDILKAREKAKALKKKRILSIEQKIPVEEEKIEKKSDDIVPEKNIVTQMIPPEKDKVVESSAKIDFGKVLVQPAEEKVEKKEEELLELAQEELSKPAFIGEKIDITERREFLSFRISNELYGVELKCLKEIIKLRELTEVPKVSKYIRGVISLRGVIIPIIELREILNLPVSSQDANGRRIVVVEIDNILAGFTIDSIFRVLRIPVSSLEMPPPIFSGIDAEFIEYVCHIENPELSSTDLVVILNMEKIIAEIQGAVSGVKK